MSANKKTHNSFFVDKVKLRSKVIGSKSATVLDCFSAHSKIWRAIKSSNDRIKVFSLDIKEMDADLVIDNKIALESMDLDFDFIDLDAYGSPDEQIAILIDRGYSGIVFFTFITSGMGRLSNRVLKDLGYSKEMIETAPILCSRGHSGQWDQFKTWLSIHGIKEIVHRSHKRKHYGVFSMAKTKNLASKLQDGE
jgi:hypothetical protein